MEKIREVVIILGKCGESHKTYGMRTENVSRDKWSSNWAFPIKEAMAKREGYDKTVIKGGLWFTEEYPGCPYCGAMNVTVCSCGRVGCTIVKNGVYTCEWCGAQGEIVDYDGGGIIAGGDL